MGDKKARLISYFDALTPEDWKDEEIALLNEIKEDLKKHAESNHTL